MSGFLGKGSQFALGSTTVAELTQIGLPGVSSDDIDVTTHNTSDYVRTFIKGLTDAGEVACEANFNYTDYATVYTGQFTQSLYSCTIHLPTTPSATQLAFSGYVKGLDGGSPHDDKIEDSFTVKVCTKPVLTQV